MKLVLGVAVIVRNIGKRIIARFLFELKPQLLLGVSYRTFFFGKGGNVNVCKGHTHAFPRQCQGDQEELLRVPHARETAQVLTHLSLMFSTLDINGFFNLFTSKS